MRVEAVGIVSIHGEACSNVSVYAEATTMHNIEIEKKETSRNIGRRCVDSF